MEKPPHVNTESTGTEKTNNLELIRPDASLEVIPIGFCSCNSFPSVAELESLYELG